MIGTCLSTAELRNRVERQQERLTEIGEERDRALAERDQQACGLVGMRSALARGAQEEARHRATAAEVAALSAAVAAQTRRREMASGADAAGSTLSRLLRGQRVLYVGGRPSSNPAIRDLVLRHGGEYQRHDGGIEDRKGLLASAAAWATLVVFPVDCIDHDSALVLKRICMRQGTRFVALRSAGVASFANGVSALETAEIRAGLPAMHLCPKHG